MQFLVGLPKDDLSVEAVPQAAGSLVKFSPRNVCTSNVFTFLPTVVKIARKRDAFRALLMRAS